MIPEPLHPAVVHFPIVLMLLLPVVALVTLWRARRSERPAALWWGPVALAGILALSSFVAVRTGEAEEDKVEAVVQEQAIESHEEQAERFLTLSGIVFVLTTAGLLPGIAGKSGRAIATVAAAALVVAGVQVGHTGGELVYQHGAGQAYAQGQVTSQERGRASEDARADEDHDDD